MEVSMKRFLILAIMVLSLLVPTSVMADSGVVLSAVPSSVTITRSSLVTGNQLVVNAEMEARVLAGLTPIAVTLNNAGGPTNIVRINPIGAPANLQLWARDTSSNWYDINVTGWMPSTGMVIPTGHNETTNVYAISDLAVVPDTYNITVILAEVASPYTTVASGTGSVTVIGATTLTATVQAATILFSVNETALNFGTVVVGRESQIQTFYVTNNGNTAITVEALVTGQLYIDCMKMKEGDWDFAAAQGLISAPILPGATLTIVAKLVNPTAAHVGANIPGTLTFIASPVL
jgi:hypothetical protein